MIKNILTPQSNTITLSIPGNYIGKKVEILLYTNEEVQEKFVKPCCTGIARFKGLLTSKEADNYHRHLQKSRQEWDRTI